MKVLYTILFALSFIFSFAQREQKMIKQDINGDGFKEKVQIFYYLGKIDFTILTYEKGTKKMHLKHQTTRQTPLINQYGASL